jgi:hypothetical protein
MRLWRSVELPRAQFADAWAGVDKTGWTPGGLPELRAAAEALLQGPRLPMMLGRDGLEGTPASVLLARAQVPAPGPAASLQGTTSTDGWGALPSSGGVAAQAAASTAAPASMGATHVVAYSAYPAAQAAPWGSSSSVTAPTDAARLASADLALLRRGFEASVKKGAALCAFHLRLHVSETLRHRPRLARLTFPCQRKAFRQQREGTAILASPSTAPPLHVVASFEWNLVS